MYVIRHTNMRDNCPACGSELYAIEDGEYVFCMNTNCNWTMPSKAWSEYCEVIEYLKIKKAMFQVALTNFENSSSGDDNDALDQDQ